MSFQADHALTPNGDVGAALWTALIGALASDTVNTGGYNYALANKTAPESLTIYHDGDVVLRSPSEYRHRRFSDARRNISRLHASSTTSHARHKPNGQHYADLVQYIAYFHGNDAVHYMDRADYGIPQSLGWRRASARRCGACMVVPCLRDARHGHQLTHAIS